MLKRGLLKKRFWGKVDRRGPNECWDWIGAKCRDGYGQIWDGEKLVLAHRVAWKLHNDPIPDGLCVLHHCDNPGCVNPNHLFLGDHQANMDDMRAKGRGIHPKGEDHGCTKLTEKKVHEIRALLARGISQRVIGRKYGVVHETIGAINTGDSWAWLKGEGK